MVPKDLFQTKRGPFEGRIKMRSEGSGESLKVTAFAKLEGEEVSASMSMSEAKVWAAKNHNYRIIPEQMLFYPAERKTSSFRWRI